MSYTNNSYDLDFSIDPKSLCTIPFPLPPYSLFNSLCKLHKFHIYYGSSRVIYYSGRWVCESRLWSSRKYSTVYQDLGSVT